MDNLTGCIIADAIKENTRWLKKIAEELQLIRENMRETGHITTPVPRSD